MRKDTIFKDWLVIAQSADFQIEKFSRPHYIRYKVSGWKAWLPFTRKQLAVEVPQSLNSLTIGQLIRLGRISGTTESGYEVCDIVLGMSHRDTENARATDVVRLCGWVISEAEKIGKLFDSSNPKPSDEERKAGIDTLKFGLFGMLDWYAKRMHIQDQEQVANVSWMKIYKCIDMDNKQNMFNRRYQEVLNDEYRRKNKVNR